VTVIQFHRITMKLYNLKTLLFRRAGIGSVSE